MKSVAIGMISAGTGAMIAVAIMTSVFSASSSDTVKGEQIIALSERVQRSEDLLRKINKNISSIGQHNKLMSSSLRLAMEANSSGGVNTSTTLDEKQTQLKAKEINNVVGVDKKAEEQLISRLNDIEYTSSKL
jgi:hypothetical protein